MDRCSAFGFMNPTRVKVMMCPVLESPNWHVCGAATRMLSGITRSSPAFKAFARTSLALSTCLYMVDWKVGSEGKNTCQSNIGTQGELLHSSTAMPWVTRCSTNVKLWQSDSITIIIIIILQVTVHLPPTLFSKQMQCRSLNVELVANKEAQNMEITRLAFGHNALKRNVSVPTVSGK